MKLYTKCINPINVNGEIKESKKVTMLVAGSIRTFTNPTYDDTLKMYVWEEVTEGERRNA